MFHESPGRAGKKRNLVDPLVIIWDLVPYDFSELSKTIASERVFLRIAEECMIGRRWDPEKDFTDAGTHLFWMAIPLRARLTALHNRRNLERNLQASSPRDGGRSC